MPDKPAPVTKVRIQVPKGTKIEDLISKLEITFEQASGSGIEFNSGHCCVDVSVVSPVSTISHH
jgi:hypothetical protein